MKQLLNWQMGLIVVLLAGAVTVLCNRRTDTRAASQASALDTAYSRDTASYRADTLATDAVGTDSTVPRPAVAKERASAVKAIKTGEAKAKNAQQQLRAAAPRLALFVGAVAEADPLDLRHGRLMAEVGAQLALQRTLHAWASWRLGLTGDGPSTVNLGVRQSFRLR